MFSKLTDVEVGLLLKGLRAIYVAAEKRALLKLIKELETTLKSRGLVLKVD